MSNVTLSVDEETIRKVRKIAVDKNTTLTAMVREFLNSVADNDADNKKLAIKKLRKSFETMSRDMGKRTWGRDGLYER